MGTKSTKVHFEATGSIELARVWSEVREGRYQVASAAALGETYYLSLRRCVPRRIYSKSSLDEVELVLTKGTKRASIALEVAPSTLALRLKATLGEMKVPTKPSRVPLVLGLAIAAHRKELRLPVDLQKQPGEIDVRYSLLPELKELLSPTEFAIATLLLAGGSHADLARQRNVSVRTIANQIGAVFRRLGVSSRTELIQWLAVQEAARATASTNEAPKDDGSVTLEALQAEIDALRKRVTRLERRGLSPPKS